MIDLSESPVLRDQRLTQKRRALIEGRPPRPGKRTQEFTERLPYETQRVVTDEHQEFRQAKLPPALAEMLRHTSGEPYAIVRPVYANSLHQGFLVVAPTAELGAVLAAHSDSRAQHFRCVGALTCVVITVLKDELAVTVHWPEPGDS